MIIDNHWGFSAVDKKFHHVDTGLVDLFRHEHVLDSLRELGQRAERCQEVAITQFTLVDVIRLNAIFEHMHLFVYLTGAFPAERPIERFVHLIDGRIIK